MASIKLVSGKTVPIVKPNIGDQMEIERQMKASRPKYGPADFKEDLKLSAFQTAFALFSSLRRAGEKTSILEVLELDLGELSERLALEPGDVVPDAEDESEGEQSTDPQPAPTGGGASATKTKRGRTSTV